MKNLINKSFAPNSTLSAEFEFYLGLDMPVLDSWSELVLEDPESVYIIEDANDPSWTGVYEDREDAVYCFAKLEAGGGAPFWRQLPCFETWNKDELTAKAESLAKKMLGNW